MTRLEKVAVLAVGVLVVAVVLQLVLSRMGKPSGSTVPPAEPTENMESVPPMPKADIPEPSPFVPPTSETTTGQPK